MKTDLHRFTEKTQINKHTGCWEWQGVRDKQGYGGFKLNGKRYLAHRVSMHLFKAFDLNSTSHICHKCHRPSCVNPNHLYVGDAQTNAQDALLNGTHACFRLKTQGEDNGSAKLTAKDVERIRAKIKNGATNIALGKEFNVHHSTISAIRRGVNWK